MKLLIIYYSKRGSTADLAKRLAGFFDNAVVCDIKDVGTVELDDFSHVVIGSAVHIGQVNKDLKKYVSGNAKTLIGKELGLFLCGLQPKEADEVFKKSFSADVISPAKAKSFLGGVYDPEKTGGFSRFVMKVVAKLSEYTNNIDDDAVVAFVDAVKK